MSPGANNWDEAEQTLYLTQNSAAASTAELTLYSLGGSQVEIPAGSGFSATAGAYQSGKQTFTFSWPANTSHNFNGAGSDRHTEEQFANVQDRHYQSEATAQPDQ